MNSVSVSVYVCVCVCHIEKPWEQMFNPSCQVAFGSLSVHPSLNTSLRVAQTEKTLMESVGCECACAYVL